uniref:GIY-YIG endonuclease n=1 Tax=Ramaria rubella TaxID=113071 RepID=UPI0022378595
NLRRAQDKLSIETRTLNIYTDTFIPYKGFYYFSKELTDSSNLLSQSNPFIISNYTPKKIWVYSSNDVTLVNNKPFETLKAASLFIGTSRSTIISILDSKIAMSKGYYCFSKELSEDEILELKAKGVIRDTISSLSIPVWVYTLDLKLVNEKPFKSQQDMLKALNLKRVRTINKYKDTGICFKGFYFFSKKPYNDRISRS